MKAVKTRPLTPKQKSFVKHIVENPKESAVQAVIATYGKEGKPPTYNSANQIARDNLQKPTIVSELSKYNGLVEDTILNTINDWKSEENSRKREIAVESAKWVHDKLHGRAKQQLEVTATRVQVNIDLTGESTS